MREQETALRMFKSAKRVLRAKGRLMIVANRHLAYKPQLKRLFGNAELLGNDAKFVVLSSLKRG